MLNRKLEFFDAQPIELHSFKFRARSVQAVGRPSIEQWRAAFEFGTATAESAPYWAGDLLAYAESREDYRERLDQAKSSTGLSEKTLTNAEYVAKRVSPDTRTLAPSYSHVQEVAPLEPDDQKTWLKKATKEGWNRRELRVNLRTAKRQRIIQGQATLVGLYRVWYVDPPWQYRDSGPTEDGSLAKAEGHYKTMSIEDLMKIPVAAHTTKDAVLFMWVTAPLLMQNPGPRDVMEAWGFTYKSNMIWDKVLGMPGHYFHVKHEHLIVATRGQCAPDGHDLPPSILVERRSNKHSEKPASARALIEKMYTTGPYVEMFARSKTDRWAVFGDDPALEP